MTYNTTKWIYEYEDDIRYVLGTKGNNPIICFGINPSTAKPDELDPTLQSVERLAKYNGYDSWIMLNIFPLRETNPDLLKDKANDELHQKNLDFIKDILEKYSKNIWVAWGTTIEKHKYLTKYLLDIYDLAKNYSADWYSIGEISKNGHPHHPLYLNSDTKKDKFDIESYIKKLQLSDTKLISKYNSKAKDSFNTKLKMFLYSNARIPNYSEHIDFNEFESFKIDDDLVKEYTTIYWQLERNKKVIDINSNELNIVDDIYKKLVEWEQKYIKEIKILEQKYVTNFEKTFPLIEFERLLKEKKCAYCDISIDEVKQLAEKQQLFKKNERGWALEIDRKNSNYEYSKSNCVMACYWCNNAKTDEFTCDEFKLIGISIGKIWEERLKK